MLPFVALDVSEYISSSSKGSTDATSSNKKESGRVSSKEAFGNTTTNTTMTTTATSGDVNNNTANTTTIQRQSATKDSSKNSRATQDGSKRGSGSVTATAMTAFAPMDLGSMGLLSQPTLPSPPPSSPKVDPSKPPLKATNKASSPLRAAHLSPSATTTRHQVTTAGGGGNSTKKSSKNSSAQQSASTQGSRGSTGSCEPATKMTLFQPVDLGTYSGTSAASSASKGSTPKSGSSAIPFGTFGAAAIGGGGGVSTASSQGLIHRLARPSIFNDPDDEEAEECNTNSLREYRSNSTTNTATALRDEMMGNNNNNMQGGVATTVSPSSEITSFRLASREGVPISPRMSPPTAPHQNRPPPLTHNHVACDANGQRQQRLLSVNNSSNHFSGGPHASIATTLPSNSALNSPRTHHGDYPSQQRHADDEDVGDNEDDVADKSSVPSSRLAVRGSTSSPEPISSTSARGNHQPTPLSVFPSDTNEASGGGVNRSQSRPNTSMGTAPSIFESESYHQVLLNYPFMGCTPHSPTDYVHDRFLNTSSGSKGGGEDYRGNHHRHSGGGYDAPQMGGTHPRGQPNTATATAGSHSALVPTSQTIVGVSPGVSPSAVGRTQSIEHPNIHASQSLKNSTSTRPTINNNNNNNLVGMLGSPSMSLHRESLMQQQGDDDDSDVPNSWKYVNNSNQHHSQHHQGAPYYNSNNLYYSSGGVPPRRSSPSPPPHFSGGVGHHYNPIMDAYQHHHHQHVMMQHPSAAAVAAAWYGSGGGFPSHHHHHLHHHHLSQGRGGSPSAAPPYGGYYQPTSLGALAASPDYPYHHHLTPPSMMPQPPTEREFKLMQQLLELHQKQAAAGAAEGGTSSSRASPACYDSSATAGKQPNTIGPRAPYNTTASSSTSVISCISPGLIVVPGGKSGTPVGSSPTQRSPLFTGVSPPSALHHNHHTNSPMIPRSRAQSEDKNHGYHGGGGDSATHSPSQHDFSMLPFEALPLSSSTPIVDNAGRGGDPTKSSKHPQSSSVTLPPQYSGEGSESAATSNDHPTTRSNNHTHNNSNDDVSSSRGGNVSLSTAASNQKDRLIAQHDQQDCASRSGERHNSRQNLKDNNVSSESHPESILTSHSEYDGKQYFTTMAGSMPSPHHRNQHHDHQQQQHLNRTTSMDLPTLTITSTTNQSDEATFNSTSSGGGHQHYIDNFDNSVNGSWWSKRPHGSVLRHVMKTRPSAQSGKHNNNNSSGTAAVFSSLTSSSSNTWFASAIRVIQTEANANPSRQSSHFESKKSWLLKEGQKRIETAKQPVVKGISPVDGEGVRSLFIRGLLVDFTNPSETSTSGDSNKMVKNSMNSSGEMICETVSSLVASTLEISDWAASALKNAHHSTTPSSTVAAVTPSVDGTKISGISAPDGFTYADMTSSQLMSLLRGTCVMLVAFCSPLKVQASFSTDDAASIRARLVGLCRVVLSLVPTTTSSSSSTTTPSESSQEIHVTQSIEWKVLRVAVASCLLELSVNETLACASIPTTTNSTASPSLATSIEDDGVATTIVPSSMMVMLPLSEELAAARTLAAISEVIHLIAPLLLVARNEGKNEVETTTTINVGATGSETRVNFECRCLRPVLSSSTNHQSINNTATSLHGGMWTRITTKMSSSIQRATEAISHKAHNSILAIPALFPPDTTTEVVVGICAAVASAVIALLVSLIGAWIIFSVATAIGLPLVIYARVSGGGNKKKKLSASVDTSSPSLTSPPPPPQTESSILSSLVVAAIQQPSGETPARRVAASRPGAADIVADLVSIVCSLPYDQPHQQQPPAPSSPLRRRSQDNNYQAPATSLTKSGVTNNHSFFSLTIAAGQPVFESTQPGKHFGLYEIALEVPVCEQEILAKENLANQRLTQYNGFNGSANRPHHQHQQPHHTTSTTPSPTGKRAAHSHHHQHQIVSATTTGNGSIIRTPTDHHHLPTFSFTGDNGGLASVLNAQKPQLVVVPPRPAPPTPHAQRLPVPQDENNQYTILSGGAVCPEGELLLHIVDKEYATKEALRQQNIEADTRREMEDYKKSLAEWKTKYSSFVTNSSSSTVAPTTPRTSFHSHPIRGRVVGGVMPENNSSSAFGDRSGFTSMSTSESKGTPRNSSSPGTSSFPDNSSSLWSGMQPAQPIYPQGNGGGAYTPWTGSKKSHRRNSKLHNLSTTPTTNSPSHSPSSEARVPTGTLMNDSNWAMSNNTNAPSSILLHSTPAELLKTKVVAEEDNTSYLSPQPLGSIFGSRKPIIKTEDGVVGGEVAVGGGGPVAAVVDDGSGQRTASLVQIYDTSATILDNHRQNAPNRDGAAAATVGPTVSGKSKGVLFSVPESDSGLGSSPPMGGGYNSIVSLSTTSGGGSHNAFHEQQQSGIATNTSKHNSKKNYSVTTMPSVSSMSNSVQDGHVGNSGTVDNLDEVVSTLPTSNPTSKDQSEADKNTHDNSTNNNRRHSLSAAPPTAAPPVAIAPTVVVRSMLAELHNHTPLFTVNPRGTVTSWNWRMEDLTGFWKTDVMGKSIYTLLGSGGGDDAGASRDRDRSSVTGLIESDEDEDDGSDNGDDDDDDDETSHDSDDDSYAKGDVNRPPHHSVSMSTSGSLNPSPSGNASPQKNKSSAGRRRRREEEPSMGRIPKSVSSKVKKVIRATMRDQFLGVPLSGVRFITKRASTSNCFQMSLRPFPLKTLSGDTIGVLFVGTLSPSNTLQQGVDHLMSVHDKLSEVAASVVALQDLMNLMNQQQAQVTTGAGSPPSSGSIMANVNHSQQRDVPSLRGSSPTSAQQQKIHNAFASASGVGGANGVSGSPSTSIQPTSSSVYSVGRSTHSVTVPASVGCGISGSHVGGDVFASNDGILSGQQHGRSSIFSVGDLPPPPPTDDPLSSSLNGGGDNDSGTFGGNNNNNRSAAFMSSLSNQHLLASLSSAAAATRRRVGVVSKVGSGGPLGAATSSGSFGPPSGETTDSFGGGPSHLMGTPVEDTPLNPADDHENKNKNFNASGHETTTTSTNKTTTVTSTIPANNTRLGSFSMGSSEHCGANSTDGGGGGGQGGPFSLFSILSVDEEGGSSAQSSGHHAGVTIDGGSQRRKSPIGLSMSPVVARKRSQSPVQQGPPKQQPSVSGGGGAFGVSFPSQRPTFMQSASNIPNFLTSMADADLLFGSTATFPVGGAHHPGGGSTSPQQLNQARQRWFASSAASLSDFRQVQAAMASVGGGSTGGKTNSPSAPNSLQPFPPTPHHNASTAAINQKLQQAVLSAQAQTRQLITGLSNDILKIATQLNNDIALYDPLTVNDVDGVECEDANMVAMGTSSRILGGPFGVSAENQSVNFEGSIDMTKSILGGGGSSPPTTMNNYNGGTVGPVYSKSMTIKMSTSPPEGVFSKFDSSMVRHKTNTASGGAPGQSGEILPAGGVLPGASGDLPKVPSARAVSSLRNRALPVEINLQRTIGRLLASHLSKGNRIALTIDKVVPFAVPIGEESLTLVLNEAIAFYTTWANGVRLRVGVDAGIMNDEASAITSPPSPKRKVVIVTPSNNSTENTPASSTAGNILSNISGGGKKRSSSNNEQEIRFGPLVPASLMISIIPRLPTQRQSSGHTPPKAPQARWVPSTECKANIRRMKAVLMKAPEKGVTLYFLGAAGVDAARRKRVEKLATEKAKLITENRRAEEDKVRRLKEEDIDGPKESLFSIEHVDTKIATSRDQSDDETATPISQRGGGNNVSVSSVFPSASALRCNVVVCDDDPVTNTVIRNLVWRKRHMLFFVDTLPALDDALDGVDVLFLRLNRATGGSIRMLPSPGATAVDPTTLSLMMGAMGEGLDGDARSATCSTAASEQFLLKLLAERPQLFIILSAPLEGWEYMYDDLHLRPNNTPETFGDRIFTLAQPVTERAITKSLYSATEFVEVKRHKDRRLNEIKRIFNTTKNSPWVRGKLLGRGSFAKVYEAFNELTKGKMAVRCLTISRQGTPEEVDRRVEDTMHEIQLMSQLEHKNVISYIYCEKEGSTINIFTEFASKGSLRQVLDKKGAPSLHVAAGWLRDVLEGLQYLHEQGIVHLDLKAANVLVVDDGTCKLADFGTSKRLINEAVGIVASADATARQQQQHQQQQQFQSLSTMPATKNNDAAQNQSIGGTLHFMAPEILDQCPTYNWRADIWSLGCLVVELLTAKLPFPHAGNALAVVGYVSSLKPGEEVILPPSIQNSDAQEFIRACLQIDPESRPSAQTLLSHPFVLANCRKATHSAIPKSGGGTVDHHTVSSSSPSPQHGTSSSSTVHNHANSDNSGDKKGSHVNWPGMHSSSSTPNSLPTHRVSGRGQSIHQMGSSLPQSNNRRPGGNLSSSGAAFGSEEATIELSQNQLPGSIRGRDGGEHTIAPPPTGSQYFGSSLLGGSRNGFGGSSGMVGGSSVYSAFGGNSTVLDAPELKFLESSDNVPPPPQPEVQQHEPHNQYVNNVHAATIGPRDVGSSSPAHLSHPPPHHQPQHHGGLNGSGMGAMSVDRSTLSNVPSLATHPPRYPTHTTTNSASASATLRGSYPTTHYSSPPGGHRLRDNTTARGASSSGTTLPQHSFGQMSEVSGMMSAYSHNQHHHTNNTTHEEEDLATLVGEVSQDVEGRHTTLDTNNTRSTPSSPTTDDGRQQLRMMEDSSRRHQQQQQRQDADANDGGGRLNDWSQGGGGSKIIQMAMTAAPRDNDGSGHHTQGPLANLDDDDADTSPNGGGDFVAAAAANDDEDVTMATSFGASPAAPEDPFMSGLSGLDDIPFITKK